MNDFSRTATAGSPDFALTAPPGLPEKLREFARQFGTEPAARVELHEPGCSASDGMPCTCRPVTLVLAIDPRCVPDRN